MSVSSSSSSIIIIINIIIIFITIIIIIIIIIFFLFLFFFAAASEKVDKQLHDDRYIRPATIASKLSVEWSMLGWQFGHHQRSTSIDPRFMACERQIG